MRARSAPGGPRCPADTKHYPSLGASNLGAQSVAQIPSTIRVWVLQIWGPKVPSRYQALLEFGCFTSGVPKCRPHTKHYSSLGALTLGSQSAPWKALLEFGCFKSGVSKWPLGYQAPLEFGCFKSGVPKCPSDTKHYSSLCALNLGVQSAPQIPSATRVWVLEI